MCYEILKLDFYNRFQHTTKIRMSKTRLRYILPILPKSMRTEYADNVWRSLKASKSNREMTKIVASSNDNNHNTQNTLMVVET